MVKLRSVESIWRRNNLIRVVRFIGEQQSSLRSSTSGGHECVVFKLLRVVRHESGELSGVRLRALVLGLSSFAPRKKRRFCGAKGDTRRLPDVNHVPLSVRRRNRIQQLCTMGFEIGGSLRQESERLLHLLQIRSMRFNIQTARTINTVSIGCASLRCPHTTRESSAKMSLPGQHVCLQDRPDSR